MGEVRNAFQPIKDQQQQEISLKIIIKTCSTSMFYEHTCYGTKAGQPREQWEFLANSDISEAHSPGTSLGRWKVNHLSYLPLHWKIIRDKKKERNKIGA